MTAVAPRLDNYVPPTRPEPTGNARKGSKIYKQLTTTDHKELGIMYIIMSFVWFFVAGLMALLIRTELAKQRGAYKGRAPSLTADEVQHARRAAAVAAGSAGRGCRSAGSGRSGRSRNTP